MKKIINVMLVFLLILSNVCYAGNNSDSVIVYVNGIRADVQTFESDEHMIYTMLSVEDIFSAIGSKVKFDDDGKSIVVTKDSCTIKMELDNNIFTINDVENTYTKPPILKNNVAVITISSFMDVLNAEDILKYNIYGISSENVIYIDELDNDKINKILSYDAVKIDKYNDRQDVLNNDAYIINDKAYVNIEDLSNLLRVPTYINWDDNGNVKVDFNLTEREPINNSKDTAGDIEILSDEEIARFMGSKIIEAQIDSPLEFKNKNGEFFISAECDGDNWIIQQKFKSYKTNIVYDTNNSVVLNKDNGRTISINLDPYFDTKQYN